MKASEPFTAAMHKVMASLEGYGSELEREHASERTHAALLRKFLAGHHAGGRVYGYKNVNVGEVLDRHGRPKRSHVVLEVLHAERDVVRRIFERYASGEGLKRLRIVPEDLWLSVAERVARSEESYARKGNGSFFAKASKADHVSPYLMTGFLRYACGGFIGGHIALHGTGPTSERKKVLKYGCNLRRNRGELACGNALRPADRAGPPEAPRRACWTATGCPPWA